MNFSDLKTELIARGFDNLTDARAGEFVNEAYQEINEAERWPYLIASATGAAPLTIADLGQIESVILSGGTVLLHEDRETILRRGLSLATTGTATRYYVVNNVVTVWPVNIAAIVVSYFKVAATLTGTDTPLVPARFHNLIVDGAARRAYQVDSNFEARDAVEAERQAGLGLMRRALLHQEELTIAEAR